MKVLVIGSGGREHALVWKIAQSPKVKKIYCAPGNTGIAELATCLPINSGDINKLVEFAKKERIDLTVVGPEDPLCKGIVDIFEKEGLKVFGANQKAVEIESSKSFAKYLMNKYGINTAAGETFTSYKKAENYIRKMGAPIVVKADGLAAGKGVIICDTITKAIDALKLIMKTNAFGNAGNKVVVEECLAGEEASFIAFTDGKTILPLPSSQDHKAIYDNDQGPNTGGMGAYSSAPIVDRYMHKKIMEEIMMPTIRAMASEGRPYKGVLYAGLMIDKDQIKVLEFNARFGDPEAQPLLMRMKNDIVPIMEATIEGTLDKCKLEIDDRAAVCVVMASKGYPGSYKKGMPISGLKDIKKMKDVVVFHAGTAEKEKNVVANGGRVLGVTALGNSVKKAISMAYSAVSRITWDGVYYRSDIGQKALKRIEQPPKVGIVMGSDSDYKIMEETVAALKKFGIPFEMTVASAHRSPEKAHEFASSAQKRGLKVIIAGAGHAAHLAGVIAAYTSLPVIGVPIDSSVLKGLDSLLSTVQMPPGIPVATMAIGKPGARNAGILAAQILAVADAGLEKMLDEYKKEISAAVEEKASKLQGQI
ncbi:MAG: phosphoribosylamine--glycine ligase [Proteobacteria bacterium]|nr:phosphoribosylamine--glycine ligase [Desulfobacteraceae bacterium]MBU4012990.1 phosphoribosylamine--glycine ligase [Pseudomonadota bacterium]MBU4067156.1 phosphoribosylamine--glycine ligase [Pseudomonadota bacterium]MBU4100276.1 phosphoribosylamine--glycine ligase [Pseudomonadota bacterium]MBU4388689.1 phosphoribosylamine--glycine ligase [Pseudomonadota bacterium]